MPIDNRSATATGPTPKSQQDFWTLSQISQLIQQHFTCCYSQSGLRRLLKRMNLYHYKPQPRDYRQSPTATQQLQTRLQATLDAINLRQESLSDFAIGFAVCSPTPP